MTSDFTGTYTFLELNVYACQCLSALGVAARAHTQMFYHATTVLNIAPCNTTMKKHIVQWHNVGIVPMKKRAQYTAHSARRHRPKAQICRNYPWGGPWPAKKLPPENRGQKRNRRGLDLKLWMKGIVEQKYDRWGLCESCVAQAKVVGPMWLMAKLTHVHFSPLCLHFSLFGIGSFCGNFPICRDRGAAIHVWTDDDWFRR